MKQMKLITQNKDILSLQKAFGYTQEDLKFLLSPMVTTGQEAIGSMGNDVPISSLSDKSKSLFTYFSNFSPKLQIRQSIQ